jgi:hypothetical protein
MIEYKYQKVKGLSEKKFLENGHTMLEEDVLQRLKRLAYLEEQIKQGQLLPIDSVVGQSEQLKCDECGGKTYYDYMNKYYLCKECFTTQ